MPSDISRSSDDGRQHYKGVVMQQGRVILDRDFNALQENVERRIDDDALDFVGPCGTPDNGFEIHTPVSPTSPPLWIPPQPLSPPTADGRDFSISPGTMYVGGQRAVFPPGGFSKPAIGYSYFDQPDWAQPDPPNRDASQEFVYLHLIEQEVGAVEDPDLKDVALGGPDTTQRIRLVKRVKRLPVSSADCATARAEAQRLWLGKGIAFDAETMRLLPQARLQVSFPPADARPNLCDPVAQGGYLGAENQLIRVQITDGGVEGRPPKLLWGYDNASFLYRVTVAADRVTLQLGQTPVDPFHNPKQGQVVEVLQTAAFLASESDEANSSRSTSIVRCIAEATGEVRSLAVEYRPADRTIVLDQKLPLEYAMDTNPLFVRIWQARLPLNPTSSDPIELKDAGGQNTTGVQVAITFPGGGGGIGSESPVPPSGAFWMLAVRPSTPQAVYPERFLTSPQPPDGPRQWVCPLAVIDWTGGTNAAALVDCREKFDNLVELTKRKVVVTGGGCCTVTIGPDDVAKDPLALQNTINGLIGRTPATVCLRPGTYRLAQPLVMTKEHSGITIEGCPARTVISPVAADNESDAQFVHGLIRVSGATGVGLRKLRLVVPQVRFFEANGGWAGLPPAWSREHIGVDMLRASIGVRVHNVTSLTVADCEIDLTPSDARQLPDGGSLAEVVPRFAAGLFASGTCDGLTVSRCRFRSDATIERRLSIWAVYGFLITPTARLEAADEGAKGAILPALLRDATVVDNTFTGMTAAALVIAQLGLVQWRNNAASGTYAGFLFSWPNAIAHLGSLFAVWGNLPSIAIPLLAASLDPPFSIGSVLARGFPAPGEFDFRSQVLADGAYQGARAEVQQAIARASKQTETTQLVIVPDPVTVANRKWQSLTRFQELSRMLEAVELNALPHVPVPSVLHITGNTVDCGAGKSSPGPGIVVLGEFLQVDPPAIEPNSIVVLLSDNRIRSSPAPEFQLPAVMIALVDRCSVSANVITNETAPAVQIPGGPPVPQPIGLVVTPSVFQDLPVQIAVTGNVLQGSSILPKRTPPWDAFKWDAFNATR